MVAGRTEVATQMALKYEEWPGPSRWTQRDHKGLYAECGSVERGSRCQAAGFENTSRGHRPRTVDASAMRERPGSGVSFGRDTALLTLRFQPQETHSGLLTHGRMTVLCR